jgi:uncharacterized protein (DUF58 family)
MTGRFFCAAAALLTLGVCALSVGAPVFYLLANLLLLALCFSLASVLAASFTCRASQSLLVKKTLRGDKAGFVFELRYAGIFPIAPVRLSLTWEGEAGVAALSAPPFRAARYTGELPARHVGAQPAGVTEYVLRDIFELFKIRKKPAPPETMLVLPRPFRLEPLRFHIADDGRALPNRTGEDPTSPDDNRCYRPGDPAKRIHWKISARKRALYVRTYETPAPPDTLILLDCAAPSAPAGVPGGERMLRDALCETALAAAEMQAADECPVRVPFYGDQAGEYRSGRAGSTVFLQEQLACQLFKGGEPFERVLALELRRMRSTGSTVIITTRLTPAVVEGVSRIRRMGPAARFYYVTFTPDAEADARLIAQLQHHLVEVCYVTPS